MQYHEFPSTDLRVSKLCFGCWGIISDAHWGQRDESSAVKTMRAAIDSGVNFFDTAPMYGNGASETLLAQFLCDNDLRDEIIIATKIRPDKMAPNDVVAECEESLARLQTDHIDLFQTHWTSREVPLEDTWDAMIRLRDAGKVKHIGVCNAGTQDLATILPRHKPLTNQLPYNLLSRMIESEIIPTCEREGIGILVYSPLLHGILAGKYSSAAEVPDGRARTRHFSSKRAQTRHGEAGVEDATFAAIAEIRKIASDAGRSMAEISLAWTLASTAVVSVIAGAGSPEQFAANLSFLENPLTSDIRQRLDEVTESLRQALDGNPDLWDAGENARYL